MVLDNQLLFGLLEQGDWTRWTTEIPSKPNYSMICPGNLAGSTDSNFLVTPGHLSWDPYPHLLQKHWFIPGHMSCSKTFSSNILFSTSSVWLSKQDSGGENILVGGKLLGKAFSSAKVDSPGSSRTALSYSGMEEFSALDEQCRVSQNQLPWSPLG